MNQTNPNVVFFVTGSIAVLACIGVLSICASLFLHTYADPAILTALITITSNLTGALITILVNTRSESGKSQPVQVTNPPSDPVQVEQAP